MSDCEQQTTRRETLTLELREAIEENSDVTQRHLARRMGVALGLANSYLKRCVRKGLVKIQQAPANRYFYYLTPQRFAEKSRLTAEFLSVSFSFYRRAAESCSEVLEQARESGVRRVGLYGASDLAEIAAVKAIDAEIKVVCLCDPDRTCSRFLTCPVVADPADAPDLDAWLFIALDDKLEHYRALVADLGVERVLGKRSTNPALPGER